MPEVKTSSDGTIRSVVGYTVKTDGTRVPILGEVWSKERLSGKNPSSTVAIEPFATPSREPFATSSAERQRVSPASSGLDSSTMLLVFAAIIAFVVFKPK